MPVKKITSDIVSPRENMNYNIIGTYTIKKNPSGNKRDDV